MEPPPPPFLDDLTEDLHSISFNSTTTTTTTNNRSTSTSSGSETTTTTTATKPHTPSTGNLTLTDIQFLHRLGAGDIGSVYLAKLKSSPPASSTTSATLFAVKVMDRKELASRNKERRVVTEREILEVLDHPFLPNLYASLESPKWSCLVTEFCSGGDLHILRQRQLYKRFPESAVRFVIFASLYICGRPQAIVAVTPPPHATVFLLKSLYRSGGGCRCDRFVGLWWLAVAGDDVRRLLVAESEVVLDGGCVGGWPEVVAEGGVRRLVLAGTLWCGFFHCSSSSGFGSLCL